MNTTNTPDYGEPWRKETYNTPMGETGDYEGHLEIWADDRRVADCWNPDDENEEDFDRIIQCVNAMAGVPDPAAAVARLAQLEWVPVTERLPKRDDANELEDVEWSDGKDIWQGNYRNENNATHWRAITLP